MTGFHAPSFRKQTSSVFGLFSMVNECVMKERRGPGECRESAKSASIILYRGRFREFQRRYKPPYKIIHIINVYIILNRTSKICIHLFLAYCLETYFHVGNLIYGAVPSRFGQNHCKSHKLLAWAIVEHLFYTYLQQPALGQSQGSVKSFHGSSTGWWADSTATLLPGNKIIARGTIEKINTEPRGPT